MSKHSRYQIVDLIAEGDFATVYRGFDKELNRDVAIKQIHPHLLTDPKKLDRYWQEAKLLASLEHPYIMTIYDLVRDKGWLILELMQGSLQNKLAGRPIDLQDLRLTLVYMCHALGFLHKNGIIHGDVKPTNLLLDKNHRVKLGDFGIARRLAGDDGSVIKGTTKYMAPEVVSDQFGPVGHHSDLYSLGFSAYELMCGEHFDSLFPGLHMFGRDPQIAWMMWHGAKDRSVPEITKVLEGVPQDIANVVQRLTLKDPTKRYLDSDEVIFDLKAHADGKDPDEIKQQEEEEKAELAKKKKRNRRFAYGAVFASMLLSVIMAFWPASSEDEADQGPSHPTAGIIESINLERSLIGLRVENAQDPQGLELNPDVDRIYVNGQVSSIDELEIGDTLKIGQVVDGESAYYLIEASRNPILSIQSTIASVDANHGEIELAADDESTDQTSATLYVPSDLIINFNGRDAWNDRVTRVRDLQVGDRISAQYVETDRANETRSIVVTRPVSLGGVLENINRDNMEVSVRVSASDVMETLPLGDDCRVTLNGVEVLATGQQVAVADLRAGDEVTIVHDDLIRSIQAIRQILSSGVVTRIDHIEGTITAELDDPKQVVVFEVSEDCMIGLTETDEERSFGFIRPGDRVSLEHDAPDFVDATAHVIRVEPLPKSDVWAAVIGFDQYQDEEITPIETSSRDAGLIYDTLLNYYRVPAQQILDLSNPTKTSLKNELSDFASGIGPNAQLIVYLSTRSYRLDEGMPVIATLETEFDQLDEMGTTLQSILDSLEQAECQEIVLMLDTCHKGLGTDVRRQISSSEFADNSRLGPNYPLSHSVTVIASCEVDQVNLAFSNAENGLFAKFAGEAFEGLADENNDFLVDGTELLSFLSSSFSSVAETSASIQTPRSFLPDPTPIRIHPETRESVQLLLGYLGQSRYDPQSAIQFETARAFQLDQPDASIAYGLINLKQSRTAESKSIFESVRGQHPDEMIPRLCLGFQYFMSRDYQAGLVELLALAERVSPNLTEQQEIDAVESMMFVAGQLREYAVLIIERSDEQVELLDQEAASLKEPFASAFQRGRESVVEQAGTIEQQIAASEDASEVNRLERDRQRLTTYSRLNFDILGDYVRYRLDH